MKSKRILTAKDFRKAIKILEKASKSILRVEGTVEVENPIERYDFFYDKDIEYLDKRGFKKDIDALQLFIPYKQG